MKAAAKFRFAVAADSLPGLAKPVGNPAASEGPLLRFSDSRLPVAELPPMSASHRVPPLLTVVALICLTMAASPLRAQPTALAGVEESARVSALAIRQEHQTHTKPLDLSRPPTTEELVAAGQLGGPLFPTREPRSRGREFAPSSPEENQRQLTLAATDEADRFSFGRAIQEWNQHDYPKAVGMFRKHVKDFPDSPWAAEAKLHVGCDATYNGRYTKAQAIFSRLIAEHQGKDHDGARMMLGKARQRLGLLKVEQNNLEEAGALFTALLESPDWRHRTYATHWIQRISGHLFLSSPFPNQSPTHQTP